jgi:hypothetical protein
MKQLSPSYRKVLKVRALLSALLLCVPAIAAEAIIASKDLLPPGIAACAALAAASLLVILAPKRRFRAWQYLDTQDELHVRHGIWFRSHTIVPFGRVQHIDLAQGPLERRYEVATIVLHTAGTLSSAVSLPGLDLAEAERMRDEIRGKIRQDLV